MKQIRDFSDCIAKIVLNKKGEHVATVQWRYVSGGGVQCDVWSRKVGESWLSLTHQKKAGGYGYDKAAAALAGAEIEGYRSGYVEAAGEKKRAALLKAYKRRANSGLPMSREDHAAFEKKAEKIGCRFANWGAVCLAEGGESSAWQSLHNESGLGRLEMLGFRVINAI